MIRNVFAEESRLRLLGRRSSSAAATIVCENSLKLARNAIPSAMQTITAKSKLEPLRTFCQEQRPYAEEIPNGSSPCERAISVSFKLLCSHPAPAQPLTVGLQSHSMRSKFQIHQHNDGGRLPIPPIRFLREFPLSSTYFLFVF